jgi:hypothetical protein
MRAGFVHGAKRLRHYGILNGAASPAADLFHPTDARFAGTRNSSIFWLARTLDILGIVALCVAFGVVEAGIDSAVVGGALLIFYLVLFRALMRPERLRPDIPSYITLEILFLVFSYLVYFAPYQLYLMGLAEPGVSRFIANTFIAGSNKAIILSALGVLSFSFGYRTMSARRWIRSNPRQAPADLRFSAERARLLSVRISRIAVGVLIPLFILFMVMGWRTEGEGRYTDSASGGQAAEAAAQTILVLSMVVLAVFVYQRSQYTKTDVATWIGVILAGMWAGRAASFGDRNSFLLMALVLFGGLLIFRYRASLPWIVIGLAVLLVLYNVSELVRMPAGAIPHGSSIMEFLIAGAPEAASGEESSFNITTMTVRASVLAVPETFEFAGGYYKVIGLLGVIPFSRGIFLMFFPNEYVTSAELLGDVMLGPDASWNVGSNVISDSYMDFGVLGVVVILFAIGAIGAAFANLVFSDPLSPVAMVMFLVSLAMFAETPRYSADFPVRTLVWSYLLLLIAQSGRLRVATPAVPGSTIGRVRRRRGDV